MLVIGNGESRHGIDIDSLKYTKIGCNAIHRDFEVEHLVCVDRRMVNEAIKTGRNKRSKVYTRRDWWSTYRLNDNIYQVPELPYYGDKKVDNPFNWGSGPYAVLIGASSDHAIIRLLGFDLYGKDAYVNNIYKDTKNYARTNSHAVDPRYWIYQISKVFELFPQKKFIIYNDNWALPKQWKFSNVTLDNISNI